MGFAAAQNQAIRLASGNWVLTLNPDVLLMPYFIQAMVEAGRLDPRIGSVCGKLLVMSPDFDIDSKPHVDSTGIYFTPMLRHLDRGSRELDNGHYLKREYVFGATAAAALYRREMIDDISMDDEFFDPDFFVYREDADVAWRAQIHGLAMPLHARRAGLSRSGGAAGQPPGFAQRDQHALGQEPLPHANQEHVRGFVSPQHLVDHVARSSGCRVLHGPRTLSLKAFWDLARIGSGCGRSVAGSWRSAR